MTTKVVILFCRQKGSENMTDKIKKIGRPTNDPKPIKLTVRVSKETNKKLEEYCKKNNISKVEGVRDAINGLK